MGVSIGVDKDSFGRRPVLCRRSHHQTLVHTEDGRLCFPGQVMGSLSGALKVIFMSARAFWESAITALRSWAMSWEPESRSVR